MTGESYICSLTSSELIPDTNVEYDISGPDDLLLTIINNT